MKKNENVTKKSNTTDCATGCGKGCSGSGKSGKTKSCSTKSTKA